MNLCESNTDDDVVLPKHHNLNKFLPLVIIWSLVVAYLFVSFAGLISLQLDIYIQ